jgi:hypothetical protein
MLKSSVVGKISITSVSSELSSAPASSSSSPGTTSASSANNPLPGPHVASVSRRCSEFTLQRAPVTPRIRRSHPARRPSPIAQNSGLFPRPRLHLTNPPTPTAISPPPLPLPPPPPSPENPLPPFLPSGPRTAPNTLANKNFVGILISGNSGCVPPWGRYRSSEAVHSCFWRADFPMMY